MDLELRGRTALITGAGTGIGLGIATVLAEEGVRVVLVGRREQTLHTAMASLRGADEGLHRYISQDLSLQDAGSKTAEAAVCLMGSIDILVNNAGISGPLSIGAPEEKWNEAYALRVCAPRQMAEYLIDGMKARGFGRIVNIGGSTEANDIVNSASVMNAARTMYFKSLSREVGSYGITANTISPGLIESEQISRKYPTPEVRSEYSRTHIPVGHFGEPRDLAVLVALLVSPVGRYITGQLISVDGGRDRYAF